VARRRSLWFHVDGAYGAAALFAPSARPRFDGIGLADSLIVDPHKWLFAPFDCAALLYREPRLAKAVHTQDASYLEILHEAGAEAYNPSDYAIHLTRRARGLPLWFSLAVNGTDAYRDAVEAVLDTAQRTAELIERTAHVELARRPELSVVLFRRPGWDRAAYDEWSNRLLESQVGFVTPTTWEGEPVARLAESITFQGSAQVPGHRHARATHPGIRAGKWQQRDMPCTQQLGLRAQAAGPCGRRGDDGPGDETRIEAGDIDADGEEPMAELRQDARNDLAGQ